MTQPVRHETPQDAAHAFAEAWRTRKWAAMLVAVQTSRRNRERVTIDRLRNLFGSFHVTSFAIVGDPVPVSEASIAHMVSGKAVPLTPEAVDVTVHLRYRLGKSGVSSREAVFRVVREDIDGMPLMTPEGGSWGVNETSALRQA
jgi:hypothetical protein